MTLLKLKNNRLNNFSHLENAFNFPALLSNTFDTILKQEEELWMPAVNIKERSEDFKIDLAVPGMDKNNFTIEVDNKTLQISGERKEENNEENENISRREFHYGSFKRSFNLPENSNTDAISANYINGILSLTIAKNDDSKTKPKKLISIE